MGHKGGGGGSQTVNQNTQSTTTSFVQPMTMDLINQAVQGAQVPPNLVYAGLNEQELGALNTLMQGRNQAAQQGIVGAMSDQYQVNLRNAASMQAQGDTAGAQATKALATVSPLLDQSKQYVANAQTYLQQQGASLQKMSPLLGQAETTAAQASPFLTKQGQAIEQAMPWLNKQGQTAALSEAELNKGQALLNDVATGQKSIANMSATERANYIQAFYNADLVNQNRQQAQQEMRNNIASSVQGLNQQAIAGGGMGSSRAGVTQAALMSKALESEQKNLLDFNTQQYALASQNATQSLSERLNALTGMSNTAAGIMSGANSRLNAAGIYGNTATGFLNAGAQYGNVAQGYQNQANTLTGLAQGYGAQAQGFGNVATSYNQGANTLAGLAGQFGQLGSQYLSQQGQLYNQANASNNLANTQMNNVFTMNSTLNDQSIKDAANKFSAGQIIQQNTQQAANTHYQNQLLQMNPALSKLQTILPTLDSVANWQTSTVNRGLTQTQANQMSSGQKIGGLVGGLAGLAASNYLGGGTQAQTMSAGLGGYIGSSLFS